MSDESTRTAVRRLDVRRVIGGLFVVYGLIVGIAGIVDGHAVNRWTGLAMFVLGVLFLLWQWWRPLVIGPPGEDVADEDPR